MYLGMAGERWQESMQTVLSGRRPVVVYFPTSDARYLMGERHWIRARGTDPLLPDVEGVVQLLQAGPASADLLAPLPPGTQLLDWTLRGGDLWVNFSEQLIRGHPGGSAGEIMTIYALVNSLTEWEGIARVRVLVEGRTVSTLVGHLDLSEPLERDESLILQVRTAPLPLDGGTFPFQDISR